MGVQNMLKNYLQQSAYDMRHHHMQHIALMLLILQLDGMKFQQYLRFIREHFYPKYYITGRNFWCFS